MKKNKEVSIAYVDIVLDNNTTIRISGDGTRVWSLDKWMRTDKIVCGFPEVSGPISIDTFVEQLNKLRGDK